LRLSIWRGAVAAGAATIAFTQAGAADIARQVLPDSVVPLHYDLAFVPDEQALTFTGDAAITINVSNPTKEITVNALGLDFDRAAIDGGAPGTISYDEALGRATIRFAQPVSTGKHRLDIAYRGKLATSTDGIFAMDYDTSAGKKRIIGTNLEPAYARQVFPGWDEPNRKATFTVTVDAPKDQTAISNMPVAKVVDVSPTVKRVTFAETPKMSTYLFFLGLGDFERIHRSVDGVDVGVEVKRGDTAKAAYALDQASKLLHYYNGYFGTPFPLPKLDLIAAPGELEGGSMENWGAIFYSQDHLLFDPVRGTDADKQQVFLVVSHEMAHQWFGDLVTMNWWDNLWLNEGFARWMQTYAADALHPEWQTGLKAQSIFESGKMADALPSTHPIVQPIATANQAAQAFDNITYDKGAAVITMLNAYIGQDAFRDGVQRYMKAHAYGNTVDADLWGVMQKVTGKPVLKVEHDFTAQSGLPLIRVSGANGGLHLAEDRFYLSGPAVRPAGQSWQLPLTIASTAGAGMSILLDGASDVPASAGDIVNAGQKGYARVLYPQPMFDGLAAKVPAMQPVDQIGLLQDADALGVAGYAPESRVLQVVSAMPANADPIVWQRIAGTLESIDRYYPEGKARTAFRGYAVQLLQPALAGLGSAPKPGEPANAPIARATITQVLGSLGDPSIVARSRALVESGGGTPAEQRTALAVAAAKADPAFFDLLLARARATKDPLEKLHLYTALAGVENPVLARRMVDIALSREVPAGSNVNVIFPIAVAHPDLAWETIVPRLGDPEAGIDERERWLVAGGIAGMSSDEPRVAQLEAYAQKNIPADARKPIEGSVAAIRTRHRVASEVLPQLDRWIATHPL
jgi:aminopeptidase N